MIPITTGMTGAQVRTALNSLAKQYNVKSYGALGDGITDDTVAIQACINAVYAANGGDVYFPNGIYIIGGALQTNIGGINPNCQLYLNPNNYELARSIRFVGESARMFIVSGNYGAGSVGTRGVILKSTLAFASGTNPSVIGGGDITNWIFDEIKFENIVIQCKHTASGPVLTGVNGSFFNVVSFRNFAVAIDVAGANSSEPTNECAGVIAGPLANTIAIMDGVTVIGFKYGIVACEHLSITNAMVYCCAYGLVLPRMQYSMWAGILTICWSKVALYSLNAPVMGQTNGINYVNINSLELEMNIATGKWYDHVTTIVDANNYIAGKLRYVFYKVGVGTPSWDDFSQTGAASLSIKKHTEA